MESSDSPNCNQGTGIEKPCRLLYQIPAIYGVSIAVQQDEMRTASFTCDGLCMMAAARGIGILITTFLTHWKLLHHGPFTVIREFVDDAVTGATIHARCCPVRPVPSPAGVDICKTLLAGCDVRRDHPGHSPRTAGQDQEVFGIWPFPGCYRKVIDPGKWRARTYGKEKVLKCIPLRINFNLTPEILHVTGNPVFPCTGIHKRTETYALDNPTDEYFPVSAHRIPTKLYGFTAPYTKWVLSCQAISG